MAALPEKRIRDLLAPYLCAPATPQMCAKISLYLDLLALWNAKVSLTSLRDPAHVVQRHFGESFFLAERLPTFETLLDFGSGAGFPGLPIALLHPAGRVVLAEANGRKAAFLREAVWKLELRAEVVAGRVEQMPDAVRFDVVALRAVDGMAGALQEAARRVNAGGRLAYFAGEGTPKIPAGFQALESVSVPLTTSRWILASTTNVPRGT